MWLTQVGKTKTSGFPNRNFWFSLYWTFGLVVLGKTKTFDRSCLFYVVLTYQMHLTHALLILGKMTHIALAEHTNQTMENKNEMS
jgi:hypothetical protein